MKNKKYIFDFIGLMLGAAVTSLYTMHLTKMEVRNQLDEALAEKEENEEES